MDARSHNFGWVNPNTMPLLVVYALFAGVATTALGIYKLPQMSIAALPSKWGVIALIGTMVAIYSARRAVMEWRRSRPDNERSFWIAVTAALLSVMISIGSAEALLRLLIVNTDDGVSIGGISLLPTWPELAERNRRLLQDASPSGTWKEPFVVFDADLGWVVGKDRVSANGLYMTSAEGIRSGERGVWLTESRPPYRIAIVGDSNAFAMEVSFEDSWGYQLEKALGSDVQVLNFGVGGYGLDQAVLRYERDVRPFEPDLVIFAFIQHDLIRSMVVYTFIDFPRWNLPFAKPRFVLTDQGLETVNTPLPEPRSWFDIRDLTALPHISLDHGYRSGVWGTGLNHGSMLTRLFATLVPRYPTPGLLRAMQRESTQLNEALLRRFYQNANGESEVLLVYVPTEGAGDFQQPPRENQARQALGRAGLPYFDLTACLTDVPESDRRVASEQHYSPAANRAIARCLENEVGALIRRNRRNVTLQ